MREYAKVSGEMLKELSALLGADYVLTEMEVLRKEEGGEVAKVE